MYRDIKPNLRFENKNTKKLNEGYLKKNQCN